jgi:hypothetical protein
MSRKRKSRRRAPGFVDLDRIVFGESGEPLHELLIERMAVAMRAGKTFPAVTGYRGTDGKLVLIDGRKRFEAAKRTGQESVLVCVITSGPPPGGWEALRRELNEKVPWQMP